jgi:hypothetical protein
MVLPVVDWAEGEDACMVKEEGEREPHIERERDMQKICCEKGSSVPRTVE